MCFVGWDWLGGELVDRECEYCGANPTHNLCVLGAVSSSSSEIKYLRSVLACDIAHANAVCAGKWDEILSMGWTKCNDCAGSGYTTVTSQCGTCEGSRKSYPQNLSRIGYS